MKLNDSNLELLEILLNKYAESLSDRSKYHSVEMVVDVISLIEKEREANNERV